MLCIQCPCLRQYNCILSVVNLAYSNLYRRNKNKNQKLSATHSIGPIVPILEKQRAPFPHPGGACSGSDPRLTSGRLCWRPAPRPPASKFALYSSRPPSALLSYYYRFSGYSPESQTSKHTSPPPLHSFLSPSLSLSLCPTLSLTPSLDRSLFLPPFLLNALSESENRCCAEQVARSRSLLVWFPLLVYKRSDL